MNFDEKLSFYIEMVNNKLSSIMIEKEVQEKIIYKAMKYSVMAGGKRIRPVLALAVADVLDGHIDEVLPFACAIELIHTYSLIHDDLPSMDNDDLRRGLPTNHKVFGEAMAILAGDGLLNYAFEIMTEACLINSKVELINKVKAMEVIAKSSGVNGMIGGQVIDVQSEGNIISHDILERMYKMKTGALLKASVISAALLSNATSEELTSLETFSENLGLAFQIKDDILDVEGAAEVLGKNLGSDIANNKATYVTLYGVNRAKEMLEETTNKAIESLSRFGSKGAFLIDLANYLLKRDH
ncbi:MAG TPA: polyprenyl synthetase family protein [Clostridiaceae bacterium]|nr:polyprenyl synthetase family protein [Clostridiaceae bacterium]